MKKLNNKGFTIVELVIVIAVIAILASVLIPTFSGVVGKANESSALQTARSTLTNALNMSSTAQLAGQTSSGGYRTMFVVNGYAYGYTGNELKAINYPTSNTTVFKHAVPSANPAVPAPGENGFNTILIAAENLKNDNNAHETPQENDTFTIQKVSDVIKAWSDENKLGCTDFTGECKVTYVDGHYYVNYSPATGTADQAGYRAASWDAEVFLNSDFSNKVVVFTTFG